MAELQVVPRMPEITPDLRLAGWHREFRVELLGNGEARLFVRAVEGSSFKATELQRAILSSGWTCGSPTWRAALNSFGQTLLA